MSHRKPMNPIPAVGIAAIVAFYSQAANADMAAAEAFIASEIGELSVLSVAEQEAEMWWFVEAAKPLADIEINVASGTIATHEYESRVLAPAFTAITGIDVKHHLLSESDLLSAQTRQMRSGENLFDAYVSNSDFLGTHWSYRQARSLTDWMSGDGADFTLPTLDIDDFIGTDFTTAPDGQLYQLPDQQSVNLYWFRQDWFSDAIHQTAFREQYGYELGVPVNWSAYEDIAKFFASRTIEGRKIFGHMDYGNPNASLGRRIASAWLSLAGSGDAGLPNGMPVADWGIRVNSDGQSAGSCIARGGATNAPAAVYALMRYQEWLNNYAPVGAASMTFDQASAFSAQGSVAQQLFWYSSAAQDMLEDNVPVVGVDGVPKWRVAPVPVGAYWKDGQKRAHSDVGAWTLMESTPVDQAKAAWLYAQFVVSKTMDLKKAHEGLTFVRLSTLEHESFTDRAAKLGGLIEFYRSAAREDASPTGATIPDYPRLAGLWSESIGAVLSGTKTPRQALDDVCLAQENVFARLQRSGVQGDRGPTLIDEQSPEFWLSQSGAPKAKLDNEEPSAITISYDELLESWTN